MTGPDEHCYLNRADDAELLKAQKDDAWCRKVTSLITQLQSEGMTEDKEADIIKLPVNHDILKKELKQWFVEPGTGLLMREGYTRNRVTRKDIITIHDPSKPRELPWAEFHHMKHGLSKVAPKKKSKSAGLTNATVAQGIASLHDKSASGGGAAAPPPSETVEERTARLKGL